jgi:prepilin-type N-terminal cleavage/methylation domain-containing protein/prepilin-type processing-associated H-X9-DG protein
MAIKASNAFTLIELLVVISIIAVISGMLLSGVQLVRFSANSIACANNLRGLAAACLAYGADNEGRIDMRSGNGHFGNGTSYTEPLWSGDFVSTKGVFACPTAIAIPGMSLKKYNQQFDDNDVTVCASYYMHVATWQFPADVTEPRGPSSNAAETRGWIKTLSQARATDAMLCEWSRILSPAQEPGSISSHSNHWRTDRPAQANLAWFDGHVTTAGFTDLYMCNDVWAIKDTAKP